MSLEGIWARRIGGSRGAARRGESIIGRMVIDMNEAQVRSVEQMLQVLAGTQALEFRQAGRDQERYAWIGAVLGRVDYNRLKKRPDRGVVLRYLQRLSGYSRAQVKRLVATWLTGRDKPLVKRYHAPEHAYARRYTDADVALLVEVDRAMGTLSGPATACVLRRQRDVFGDPRFARLGSISVGHLYNLRHSAGYRGQRVALTKTRPTKAVTIGVRRAPSPEGRPGFIRIDSVHQGDWDGTKGVYHINAVDCVTQWQVVATVQTISEAYLLPVIRQMLGQFPFEILGFHADNGSEYVNHRVACMLDKLRIEFTRSRPRHSNDNGLVETKNGAVVRKLFGYEHIAQPPRCAHEHLLHRVPQPVPELPPALPVRHRAARSQEAGAYQAGIPSPGCDDPAGQAEQPGRSGAVPQSGRHARSLAGVGTRAHRHAGGRGTQRGSAGPVPTRPGTYRLNAHSVITTTVRTPSSEGGGRCPPHPRKTDRENPTAQNPIHCLPLQQIGSLRFADTSLLQAHT